MTDQVLSSLTNFGLAVLVARAVGIREFGAFGLAFAVYLLVLNAARGLASQPLLLRSGVEPADEARSSVASATAVALLVGLVAGVATALVGVAVGGSLGQTLVALGVVLPGLMLQDAWRYAYIATRRPQYAVLNDLIWAVVQAGLFLWLLMTVRAPTCAMMVLCWGAAAGAAGLWCVIQARTPPTPIQGIRWALGLRDIGPALMVEAMVVGGIEQATLFAIGIVGGLEPVAAFRAAQVALGPLGMLFSGVLYGVFPEAVRLHRISSTKVPEMCRRLAKSFAVVAVLWGGVVFAIPDSLGRHFLGESWQPAHRIVFILGVQVACAGVLTSAFIGMRVHEAARTTLLIRFAQILIVPAAGFVGFVIGGVIGAAIATAGATGGCALVGWRRYNHIDRLSSIATKQTPRNTNPRLLILPGFSRGDVV